MGFFRRPKKSKGNKPNKVVYANEDDCPSCGAHYLQSCSCTEDEIEAAEERFENLKKNATLVRSGTLKEILERNRGSDE